LTSDQTLLEPEITFGNSERKMPVIFVGHGSPMNAIEENEFSRAWMEIGKSIPKPKAILCISAHWETDGTQVTAMTQPKTIHDFYGFPPALYKITYPAPCSPELAQLVQRTVKKVTVSLDHTWGFDHGAWSVLRRMFPNADIPVAQLSLDRTKDSTFHYELGKELYSLRYKGILIVGSGNMVHNLGMMSWQDKGYDWAIKFDETLRQFILSGDHDSLVHYGKLGKAARLSIPTNEHYLPLLYTIAMQDKQDSVLFFAEQVTLGSISMRSLQIG
jgi:4,5-DOPA dioxygenase extradiol